MKKTISIISLFLLSLVFATPLSAYTCTELTQNLKFGSNDEKIGGTEVLQLKQFLKDGGYLKTKLNGSFGGETTVALRKFQKEQGIIASGTVATGYGATGPLTRERIKAISCSTNPPTEDDNVPTQPTIVPTINITAPTSGSFEAGKNVTVKWTYTNLKASDTVDIVLKKGNEEVFKLEKTKNDKNQSVTLPSNLTTGSDYKFFVAYTNTKGIKYEGFTSNLYINGLVLDSMFVLPKPGSSFQSGGKIKIELKEAVSQDVKLSLFKKENGYEDVFYYAMYSTDLTEKKTTINLPKNISSGNYYFKLNNSTEESLDGIGIASGVFTIENKKELPNISFYGNGPQKPLIIGTENNIKWTAENIGSKELRVDMDFCARFSQEISDVECVGVGKILVSGNGSGEKNILPVLPNTKVPTKYIAGLDKTMIPHYFSLLPGEKYVAFYTYEDNSDYLTRGKIKTVYPFNIDMPITTETVSAGSEVKVNATSPLPEGSEVTVSVDLKTSGTSEQKDYFVENLKVIDGKISTSFKIPEITNLGVAIVKVTYKTVTMFAKVNYKANTNRKVYFGEGLPKKANYSNMFFCDVPMKLRLEGFPSYDTLTFAIPVGYAYDKLGRTGYSYKSVSSTIDADGYANITFPKALNDLKGHEFTYIDIMGADGTNYGSNLDRFRFEQEVVNVSRLRCMMWVREKTTAVENQKINSVATIIESSRDILELIFHIFKR